MCVFVCVYLRCVCGMCVKCVVCVVSLWCVCLSVWVCVCGECVCVV